MRSIGEETGPRDSPVEKASGGTYKELIDIATHSTQQQSPSLTTVGCSLAPILHPTLVETNFASLGYRILSFSIPLVTTRRLQLRASG
jgi:hypothetical protein